MQPRGYGDVAVIWKKEIHHLIKPCKDGNERIQCIEFKLQLYDTILNFCFFINLRSSWFMLSPKK
jgi:hypothetical protein